MLKNKKLPIAVFLLMVAAGIWYPVSKIIGFEFPSSPPAVFRFSAELYDPYDPFRGRYVALQSRELTLPTDKPAEFFRDAYVALGNDENGLAKAVGLVRKPEPGKPAIRPYNIALYPVSSGSGAAEKKTYIYRIQFPFRRFYMNEKLAPAAEQVFRDAARAGKDCVIVVKVYADGNYAITDLEIDGVPIREFVKKELESRR